MLNRCRLAENWMSVISGAASLSILMYQAVTTSTNEDSLSGIIDVLVCILSILPSRGTSIYHPYLPAMTVSL